MCMKFSVLSILFNDDEPGISFGSGSDCPQTSQTCCDTPPGFGKDFARLSFLISLRCGGGGRMTGGGVKKIRLGSSLE